jgi:hypothetical protein
MQLLKQPPIVPLATQTLRTHELRLGSELVERDGTSVMVSEIGGDGPHIWLQLTNGTATTFRRNRRWRVIAPPSEVGVPFLSLDL